MTSSFFKNNGYIFPQKINVFFFKNDGVTWKRERFHSYMSQNMTNARVKFTEKVKRSITPLENRVRSASWNWTKIVFINFPNFEDFRPAATQLNLPLCARYDDGVLYQYFQSRWCDKRDCFLWLPWEQVAEWRLLHDHAGWPSSVPLYRTVTKRRGREVGFRTTVHALRVLVWRPAKCTTAKHRTHQDSVYIDGNCETQSNVYGHDVEPA